jgi:hypothetical protein
LSTAYKTAFVEKKGTSSLAKLDNNLIRTGNPISANTEPLAKSSVARSDYRQNDLANNAWFRDTKEQAAVDHVNAIIRNTNPKPTTEYREFLASKHVSDFVPVAVKPTVAKPKQSGEKRSLYNEDYRLKTASMPTYEIAKKSYEENVKMVREALTGMDVQLKGGAPVKNSSTYKTSFTVVESPSLQQSRKPSEAQLARPNPVNNWMVSRTPIQKASVYKQSYVDQQVTQCPCPNH